MSKSPLIFLTRGASRARLESFVRFIAHRTLIAAGGAANRVTGRARVAGAAFLTARAALIAEDTQRPRRLARPIRWWQGVSNRLYGEPELNDDAGADEGGPRAT